MSASDGQDSPHLKRAIGTAALTIFAIGDILGAGIYALVGVVVASAAGGAWLSFLAAGLLALLSGLTFAELGSRIPRAGGPAAYCQHAFRHPAISFTVGLVTLMSGVTSAATISRAFAGYIEPFSALPPAVVSTALLGAIGVINFLGIEASVRVNILLTAIEAGGLLLVAACGGLAIAATDWTAAELSSRLTADASFTGVIAGAGIAVFAYIGFEDTAMMAEEARDPARALPRAILVAVATTCVLYVGIAVIALLTVPLDELSGNKAPLLAVVERSGVGVPAGFFSVIAMMAIANTGLLNLIMASRLAYGMARENLMPAFLGHIHPQRSTPLAAIVVTTALAALIMASGDTAGLAQTTSLLLLTIFAVLHVALLRIRSTEERPPEGIFRAPSWTPIAGVVVCLALGTSFAASAYVRAVLVLAVALACYALFGRRGGATAEPAE